MTVPKEEKFGGDYTPYMAYSTRQHGDQGLLMKAVLS